MQCFMDHSYRLSQRAAWSVSWAARKKPELVMPHLKDIIAQLHRPDAHDAIKRNVIRILQDIDIPEAFHGEVMNACFDFIADPGTPVAVKAFSLTTLFNLSKNYPDISAELKLIIETNWDNETAAFRSRGKRILAGLSK